MNSRRNLQTRKFRRKRNEKWEEKKCEELLDWIASESFMAGRRCGKSIMAFETFKHRHGIVEFINVDGSDTGWRSIDFTTAPEDELDLVRRYHD